MAHSQNDHQPFRDYLLGKLGGEDLTAFEQQLLTDREDFEELLGAAEDDLADEYVGGQLTKEEREAFETHYLITPERQEDIEFALTLDRYFEKIPVTRPVPPRSNLTWILRAAAAVLVFAVIAIPIYQALRSTSQLATITLNPSTITRGDSPPFTKVNLGNADKLRVVLNLPSEPAATAEYRAELEYSGGGGAQTVNVIDRDSKTVTVEIPTQRLRKGQHQIKLLATSPISPFQRIATYFFIVE